MLLGLKLHLKGSSELQYQVVMPLNHGLKPVQTNCHTLKHERGVANHVCVSCIRLEFLGGKTISLD